MSLLQEQVPWVVHMVLRALCDLHPKPAWQLWSVLPAALRAAPTLAMLQRYAGKGDQGSDKPTVGVCSATQAAMNLLADSFCGRECERLAAVEPAGQVVAGLVAQGARADLELAAAVVEQCAGVSALEPLHAALVALRSRPGAVVELALPLLQSSDVRVLQAVAAALPVAAATAEAYPGMRFLARHRFESVRAVACAGLPAFAQALPEQSDDIVSILRQNSLCLTAGPSVAALKALWELGEALPEVHIEAAATARQVVRDGSPAARVVALHMLGTTQGDLESALCLAMAGQSASSSVRQAAVQARASRLARDWRDRPMGEVAQRAQGLAEADELQQRLVLAQALALHLQSALPPKIAGAAQAGAVLQVAQVLGDLTWSEPDAIAQLDAVRLRTMPVLLASLPGDAQLLDCLLKWAAKLTQVVAADVRALASSQTPGKDAVLLAMIGNERIGAQMQAALGKLWGI